MKRILRKLFRVQYRLSVLNKGDVQMWHYFANDGKMIKRMARNLSKAQYWTLYKRGPFGLPERPIDWGVREKGGEA